MSYEENIEQFRQVTDFWVDERTAAKFYLVQLTWNYFSDISYILLAEQSRVMGSEIFLKFYLDAEQLIVYTRIKIWQIS